MRLALLLIDGFPLMSYASVIEPFRAANSLSGKQLYDWVHVAVEGASITASNGAIFLADGVIGEAIECDMLLVVAAGEAAAFDHAATLAWLRRLASQGRTIAGVSGGPFVLARAGLLDRHRATIHWEHEAALRDAFPQLLIQSSLFVIDRRRVTCAGGTAGFDLAIELIEREHGAALSQQVGEWFIRNDKRQAERSQRQGLRERYRVCNEAVLLALAAMEAAIEEPQSRASVAATARVSLRQLERLFKAHLGTSIADAYVRMRLEVAAQLLRSTDMAVTEVALACGYRNSSHFSRTFKAAFGQSPRLSRGFPPPPANVLAGCEQLASSGFWNREHHDFAHEDAHAGKSGARMQSGDR